MTLRISVPISDAQCNMSLQASLMAVNGYLTLVAGSSFKQKQLTAKLKLSSFI